MRKRPGGIGVGKKIDSMSLNKQIQNIHDTDIGWVVQDYNL